MTVTVLFVLGLFVVGMLLLAVEAFVLPGFGVVGLLGGGIILFTAVQAWTELGPGWGLILGMVALVAAIGLVVFVPKSRVGRRLSLSNAMDSEGHYDDDAQRAGVAVGARGVTATPLRPSGFAMFADNRVEVRSDGSHIDRGVTVRVIELKESKVFVEPVEGEA